MTPEDDVALLALALEGYTLRPASPEECEFFYLDDHENWIMQSPARAVWVASSPAVAYEAVMRDKGSSPFSLMLLYD